MSEIISMDHGNGGVLTSELIDKYIVSELGNKSLNSLGDGALLNVNGNIGFSTDSFVIYPHFFPGGDIGELSVCGTVNDLIVSGCVPKYLSLSFILEEGFQVSSLQKIIKSISNVSKQCGVNIVTGDTKVVERGSGSGIYINTAGIGEKIQGVDFGTHRIENGDKVIITGDIGDHGISILCAREKLLDEEILSDCAPLFGLIEIIKKHKDNIKILRDPTRGGVATTLNEFIENKEFGIKLLEHNLPLNDKVKAASYLLGIDPLYSANEGKALLIVGEEHCDEILQDLKEIDLFNKSTVIGEVTQEYEGKVVMVNKYGGSRILTKIITDMLPRIC